MTRLEARFKLAFTLFVGVAVGLDVAFLGACLQCIEQISKAIVTYVGASRVWD